MSFTFIHTADWQLGAKFGQLPPEIEAQVLPARLSAIDRIAAIATAAGAKHVLVAGDVFDSVTAPRALLNQTLAHLGAYPDLVWHLLPGNHDPVQPGSLWAALASHPSLGHVRLHLTAAPAEIAPGVVLLPAPLTAKAMSTDPTAYMDAHCSAPDTIRIGLAHGSAASFGTSGDAKVPINPSPNRPARLDYLALGDWHGLTEINPRVWYSGTPEPDTFKSNDPGYVLAVTIAAPGAKPEVKRHRTGLFTWLDRTLDIDSAAKLLPLVDELKSLGAPQRPILLKLALHGSIGLADMAAITAATDVICGLVKYLDLDQSALHAALDATALETVFTGGLAGIASRLAAPPTDADANAQRIAARALLMLARLSGDVAL